MAQMARPIGRSFSFDFAGPLPAVWSAMADTARYNAAAALPKQVVTEVPQPDGSVRFMARAKVGPFALEWEDLPCNWVRERWFEHRRRFSPRPAGDTRRALRADPAARAATATTGSTAAPRGLLGRCVLAGGFLAAAARMFARLAAQADRFAQGAQAVPFVAAAAPLAGAARAAAGGAGQAARREPLRPRPRRAAGRGGRRGAGGRCRAHPAAGPGPPLGRAGAPRDRGLPRGHAPRHAGAALGPALPALPRREGHQRQPRPAADRGALRHLQHRLWPRLLAQRRAHPAPGRQHPPDRGRRVLPARADEHAAYLGAHHARARRGARPSSSPPRPAPIGSARWRSGRRPRSSTAATGFPAVIVTDDAVLAGARREPGWLTLRNAMAEPPHASSSRSAAGSRTRSPPTGSPRCRRFATCSRPRCCAPATRWRSGA